jgi:hypothetical protein
MAKLKILTNEAAVAWHGCQIALTLSASIGVYRPQAEVLAVDVTVNPARHDEKRFNFSRL